ncbi:MAG: hypothetical protein AAGE65_00365 [Planctomycetota bacterium]
MGFSITLGRSRRPQSPDQMIAAHSAFLTWATRDDPEAAAQLPRIPTRRLDSKLPGGGGFSELMKLPAARQLAAHWWDTAIRKVRD